MAPRSQSSTDHITTPIYTPVYTPVYTPITPVQTNDTSVHTNTQKPYLIDNDTDYLEIIQQTPPYEASFGTETQIEYSVGEQRPDWEQLQSQLQLQQFQQQFQQPQQFKQYEEGFPAGETFTHQFLEDLPQEGEQFTSPFVTNHQLYFQQPEHASVSQTPPSNVSPVDFNEIPYTPLAISNPQPFLNYPISMSFPPPRTPLPSSASSPELYQQPAIQQSVCTHRTAPRPAMTSTTATAAAVFSKSSSAAAAAFASGGSLELSLGMLRIGGYTLEEAGVKLPEHIDSEERQRRLLLLAQELHYEATHPPVLPPSQVPDLPDKPPPLVMPRVQPGMSPAQRDAVAAEVAVRAKEQRKNDQVRNNLAAKKSRLLRIECLKNTRLQLNAKAAECAWLRLQIVALSGEALPHRPSEAWGGSGFVYRNKRKRAPLEDAAAELEAVAAELEAEWGTGAGPDDEEEEEQAPDVEGVVPKRIKLAITEEVRARVMAHKGVLTEQKKGKTRSPVRRSQGPAKAAEERASVDEALAGTGSRVRGQRQRRRSHNGNKP
ncbi:hypothetical protein V2A60_003046 [Cordyceps javanica]